MSSKVIARSANMASTIGRRQSLQKTSAASRGLYTSASARAGGSRFPLAAWALTGAAATVVTGTLMKHEENTFMAAARRNSGLPVIMAGEPVQEPDTGIMFPPMVNGFTFMGCGVRIKYVFVKVYAVGAYLRPENFAGIKDDDAAIEKALLDPNYHRVIRIVMNRSMTMDKYNDAIVESLKPRMDGQDLDK